MLENDEDIPENPDLAGRNWVFQPIETHPVIQMRFHPSRPAPYLKESRPFRRGTRNIPMGTKTEADFFELFYDDEILGRYVDETNKKVSKMTKPAWNTDHNLSIKELKKYFAVLMYMDCVQIQGSLRNYWQRGLFGSDFVKKMFPRKRFFAIMNNLTWYDTSDISNNERAQRNRADPFWTITELFDEMAKRSQKYFLPYREISVDEMVVFYKGRHRCRCYNPQKPCKWHFKIYALCDSKTGYLWNWHLYRGKDENRPAGMSASSYPVIILTNHPDLHNKDHILSTDNWFTSFELFDNITSYPKSMDFVGTIRINRDGFPKEAAFAKKGRNKKNRGDMQQMFCEFSEEAKAYITSWMDKKPVHMLSSFPANGIKCFRMMKNAAGQWEKKEVDFPTTIHVYNHSMGAVDKNDQLAAYYDFRIKVRKRWQPRLERRVLKTALINAHVLKSHDPNNGMKDTLLDFTKNLIVQWAYQDEVTNVELDLEEKTDQPRFLRRTTLEKNIDDRLTGSHIPAFKSKYPYNPKTKKVDKSVTLNQRMACRVCERKVSSYCKNCYVGLCIGNGINQNCFEIYHTQNSLGPKKRKEGAK